MMQTAGEAEDATLFVASGDVTYRLTGEGKPSTMRQRVAYAHGAVPGTGMTVPANIFGDYVGTAAFWLADNGVPCLGLAGGSVVPLTEDTVSMHRFERGASLLRSINGMRQVIVAGRGGSISRFAASDAVEVLQYRNGILID
jgi:hypothetical protein